MLSQETLLKNNISTLNRTQLEFQPKQKQQNLDYLTVT